MNEASAPTCAWSGCPRKRLRARTTVCFRCWKRAEEAGVTDQFVTPQQRPCVECGGPLPATAQVNRETCSATCNHRKWSRINAEHAAEAKRRWYEANRDVSQERARAQYAGDPVAGASRARAWKAANAERTREINHESRVRRRLLHVEAYVEPISAKAVWNRDEGHCWICREPVDPSLQHPHPRSRSIDHVIPLKLGGLHAMSNVALAHLGCNCSKQDKMPDRFPDWFGRGEEPGAMAPTAA